MREETVTYKIYKFSELDSKVQEKVLDNFRDINVDDGYDWFEPTYDDWYEKLRNLGFDDCKIWFSGFWSQGDGACFDCESFDIEKLIEALKDRVPDAEYKKFKRFIPKIADCIEIEINTIGHHYTHESTRRLSVEGSIYYFNRKRNRLEAMVNEFEERLEALRYDLSREIYKDLEENYEYLVSDDAVRETIERNDYEFLENGKLYRY